MALSKKKSRRIEVNSGEYRCVMSDAYLTVRAPIVESYGGHLQSSFEYRPYQLNAITPRVVRKAIEAALAQDWKPLAKLPRTFRLCDKTSDKISELALGKSGLEND